MIKHEIKDVAKKYLPIKVQSIIKILKNDKSFSKRLNNDYNVNFLPITQFIKLNYSSFRLDFVSTAKANYFQRLVKKTNKGWKSFYIENYNNKLLLTNSNGKTKSLKVDDEFRVIKEIQNFNLNNVYSVLDTLVFEDKLYISYIEKKNDCNIFSISVAKINDLTLKYKKFFTYETCGKWIQGGRMQVYNYNNQNGLLFSLADNVADNPSADAQSDSSFYGKIIYKNFVNDEEIIFSKGHRNPQGLLVDGEIIISTEHGPKGGDEINLIKYKNNYGWPLASYGSKYLDNNTKYFKDHKSHGFTEPIYAFVPSIGISEIIKIPNNLFEEWNDNYLVSSLSRGSIYRIKFEENFSKVVYIEEIFIGQRIRDLKILDNKIFLALESKGELGIISK